MKKRYKRSCLRKFYNVIFINREILVIYTSLVSLLNCCCNQVSVLLSKSSGIQMSICGLLPKSSKDVMLGSKMNVVNSVKSIPDHNTLANIPKTDKNHISNFSDVLMKIVFFDSPAVPNDKPIVLKRIELKSLYFAFRTDRRIFRKVAKIIIAIAHTLINGICSKYSKKVNFR